MRHIKAKVNQGSLDQEFAELFRKLVDFMESRYLEIGCALYDSDVFHDYGCLEKERCDEKIDGSSNKLRPIAFVKLRDAENTDRSYWEESEQY